MTKGKLRSLKPSIWHGLAFGGGGGGDFRIFVYFIFVLFYRSWRCTYSINTLILTVDTYIDLIQYSIRHSKLDTLAR